MEKQIRQAIEQGIREHLVIINEPGVKYAVDKIMKLLPDMYTEDDMCRFAEYAEQSNRCSWEEKTTEEWLKQYNQLKQ